MRTASRLLPVLLLAASACARTAGPVAGDAPVAEDAGPVIRVDASYPGASADVVCDAVAVPIEQQVNGAEGVTSLESECRNDGSYTLAVRFKPGTDVNTATALVRDRVALTEQRLPPLVRREGVTVRSGDPGRFPTLWAAVTSPDGTHDAMSLNNYAELRVKDELARVPGVADVRAVSRSEIAVRVWPDPDRLAARKLTVLDVVAAVGLQNVRVSVGRIGRDPAGTAAPLTFTYLGRLPDIEQLHRIILQATPDGTITRLGDVSRVELAAKSDGFTRVGGKPAALLAVRVEDGKSAADDLRKRLAGLEKANPKGLATALVADLSAERFAAVELRLPAGTPVAGAEKLIRGLPGSPECLAFPEREPDAVTLLVKLPAKDGPTPADIRKALAEIRGASVRVSDLSAGRPFPVRVAVLDKGGRGREKLRAAGEAVVKRLAGDGVALDPAVTPGPPSPRVSLRIDREKMTELGVSIEDVLSTLAASFGEPGVLSGVGREASIVIGIEGKFRDGADAFRRLEVKGSEGRRVPLGAIAEVREGHGSESAVLRVNLRPAVVVTADVPPGQTLAEATAACIQSAQAVVPREFEVFDPSAAQPR